MGISRDIETSQSPPEETAIQFVTVVKLRVPEINVVSILIFKFKFLICQVNYINTLK